MTPLRCRPRDPRLRGDNSGEHSPDHAITRVFRRAVAKSGKRLAAWQGRSRISLTLHAGYAAALRPGHAADHALISLRPRSCMRLRKILSQTQEFPPRRKTCFSFVQARSSVVQPFVILGAPIALSYALFHDVRHRPLPCGPTCASSLRLRQH